MGHYAGVHYNIHSRVDSNTFIMGNTVPESILTLLPESTLSPSQGLCI